MQEEYPLMAEASSGSSSDASSSGDASRLVCHGSAVRLLQAPTEYYTDILLGIRSACRDIVLCALYFGTDAQELNIINEIKLALSREPALRVKIIFDHSRTLRKKDSSLHHFHTALSGYGQRVQTCLYKMPLLQGAYWWVPSPLSETLGVYHCKFCVFDDTVFISGANLSKDYFTNRQDRYMVVKGAIFAEYFKAFYRIVRRCSYVLGGDASLAPPLETSSAVLRERLLLLGAPPGLAGADLAAGAGAGAGGKADTALFPVYQHYCVGVQGEQDRVLDILGLDIWKEIVLSSPYCSYTPAIAAAIRRASANGTSVCIITSSRAAHGFHGAQGLMSLVPELHDISLAQLVGSLKGSSNVRTMTYTRKGWSFHAKGMWCFPVDKQAPVVSYIGSSNGGERSWFRDFELGFFISTRNQQLKDSLRSELQLIQNHCTLIKNEHEIVKGINMLQLKKLLYRFVKSYL
jgi:CDP-diacylglycerol--glycerol-3-phosphate 3-phosphatidyltransferase